MTDLEVPNLFNPAHGRDVNFSPSLPDVMEAANQYKKRHNIQNGFEDQTRVELLLIDCQQDFFLSLDIQVITQSHQLLMICCTRYRSATRN